MLPAARAAYGAPPGEHGDARRPRRPGRRPGTRPGRRRPPAARSPRRSRGRRSSPPGASGTRSSSSVQRTPEPLRRGGPRRPRSRRRCRAARAPYAASRLPSSSRKRGPHVATLAEGGSRPLRRSGHDQQIAGPGARPGRGPASERPTAVTLSIDRGCRRSCRRRSPGPAPRRCPAYSSLDVLDDGRGRERERDDQGLWLGTRGGEVAQVDSGRPPAEIAPADPVKGGSGRPRRGRPG